MAELAHHWFYCPTCIHYSKNISEEPCLSCTTEDPIVDTITHCKVKPSRYEEAEQ